MAHNDDWSVQLKKIEREFEGLPPEPSPALKKLQSEEERRAQERVRQRAAMFGAGARLILVFGLFAAIAIWPYERQCGFGLFYYLGVEAVVIVGGLWVALTTWRYRLPKMHTLSLIIILTGLVLMAVDILPRIGYAAVDPKHPLQFSCPDTENAPPRTSALGQRVQLATRSIEARLQSRADGLSRRFHPQQAASARIEHPELSSLQGP